MKLRIMSFNIQHCMNHAVRLETGKEKIDFDSVANIINECDCDIVGLNEVRGKGKTPAYEEQAEILGSLTKRTHFFGKAIDFPDGPYGNGFLSKLPIKSAEVIPVPDPDVKDEDTYYETRAVIKAVVTLENKDITVLVTHFGLAKGEQRNSVKTILAELEKARTPVILMGDFNVTPDDEIIAPIYEKINEAFDNENPYTFSSDKPYMKIDYIFLSKDFKIKNAKVIEKIASDHFGITAEAEI